MKSDCGLLEKPSCLALLGFLREAKVIPVIRGASAEDVFWGAELLLKEGLMAVELTLTTPNVLPLVAPLKAAFPNRLIGLGSLFFTTDLENVLALPPSQQPHFVVSPVMVPAMIQQANAAGLLLVPGVATLTEMVGAQQAGALAVKLFPAESLGGVAYLKAILDPGQRLNLPIIPTGGIPLEKVLAYLQAGAHAVGLGSALISPDDLARRDETALQAKIQVLQGLISMGVSE